MLWLIPPIVWVCCFVASFSWLSPCPPAPTHGTPQVRIHSGLCARQQPPVCPKGDGARGFCCLQEEEELFGGTKDVPLTLWTIPEIASVGQSEEALAARGIKGAEDGGPIVTGIAYYEDLARGRLAGGKGFLQVCSVDDWPAVTALAGCPSTAVRACERPPPTPWPRCCSQAGGGGGGGDSGGYPSVPRRNPSPRSLAFGQPHLVAQGDQGAPASDGYNFGATWGVRVGGGGGS